MCLATVTKEFNEEDNKTVLAWKMFRGNMSEDTLETAFGYADVSVGKINTATRSVIISDEGKRYRSGFHAYATNNAADRMKWTFDIVLPVVLEGVTAEGKESNWKVYVAKRMMVFRTEKEARAYMRAKEKKS